MVVVKTAQPHVLLSSLGVPNQSMHIHMHIYMEEGVSSADRVVSFFCSFHHVSAGPYCSPLVGKDQRPPEVLECKHRPSWSSGTQQIVQAEATEETRYTIKREEEKKACQTIPEGSRHYSNNWERCGWACGSLATTDTLIATGVNNAEPSPQQILQL